MPLQAARGRWNSLDSLFVFSWSGSAAFGGFLIAQSGFGMTFLITAIMQLAAWAILLPLIWLVPRSMPTSAVNLSMVCGLSVQPGIRHVHMRLSGPCLNNFKPSDYLLVHST